MNRVLIAIGILLALVGAFLLVYGAASQGGASTGGFILIGPFPIVFGSGSNGGDLAVLSVALGVMMLILVIIYGRYLLSRPRKE